MAAETFCNPTDSLGSGKMLEIVHLMSVIAYNVIAIFTSDIVISLYCADLMILLGMSNVRLKFIYEKHK